MRRTYELYIAFAAMILITFAYVPIARQGVPRASGLLGHSLGIIGFVMMLMTETLYSLRKRTRGIAFGRMSTWLQFHIFTGIVGPYLVLLHASWKYNGLAAVVMLLTIVVVVSGFIGRYIYTAVPRTADGAEIAIRDLAERIAAADAQLQAWNAGRPAVVTALTARLTALADTQRESGVLLVLGRAFLRWGYERKLQSETRKLDAAGRAQSKPLQKLLDERYRLQSEIRSLAVARRLLALWHTIHIPIGMAMFALAFIHAGAALYYATLMR